jgi:MFS family permease
MTRFIPLQWLLLEQWRRNHLAATFSAALIGAGFMLVMPFLPLYISQLGVESEAAVAIWSGVILGSSPLIASFVGPIWGKLADRFGLRIMAIRVSLVLFVIWFLMGLARNVQELLILRILSGFFGGFGSLSVALVAHSSPTDRISRAIGGLQATQTFSMALGPFAGGVLAAWIGIRNTFFVTAALCFVTLLLFLLLYRDHPHNGSPQTDGDNPKTREGLSSLLRLPNLKVVAILLLAVTVIERSFAPAIPLFVTSLSANRVQAAGVAGLILSLSAFGESLAAWFSGRRMSRASPRRLLLLRLGFGLAFCLALTLATNAAQLLVLRVSQAFLAGGTLTIAYSLASRVIPSQRRASGFGLLSSFTMMGNAFGPILAGLVASIHLDWVFLGDGILYGLVGLMVYRHIGREGNGKGKAVVSG